jgi:hypothetical protein
MKFKPKDSVITIKLCGENNTVGYLTLENDNPIVKPLVDYATVKLTQLEGYVSTECFERLKMADMSSFEDMYEGQPEDLLSFDHITKEDVVELVDAGIVELRFRKLEPRRITVRHKKGA